MIDPIPIGEELRRIKREGLDLRKREHAAVALEWFSEYALTKADGKHRVPANGVLGDKLTPIASSTPNVDRATDYLSRAFRSHHRSIIETAIRLASEDFKRANAATPKEDNPDGH